MTAICAAVVVTLAAGVAFATLRDAPREAGVEPAGAPVELPLRLGFEQPIADTAEDRRGQGTGFPVEGVTTPADALDLAAGSLTVGVEASGAEGRLAAVYDGRKPHVVEATFVAPVALDKEGQAQGILVGSREDSARLVLRRSAEGLHVRLLRSGGDEPVSDVALPPGEPSLPLTLRLVVDPEAGGSVSAGYAIGSRPPVVVGAVYIRGLGGPETVAGIAADSGASGVATRFAVDRFRITPGRPATPRWRAVADAPVARYEAQGAVVDGRVYVIGGFTDLSVRATTRADVYDPASDSWRRVADLPEPLTHAGTVVVGREIWIAGGFIGDNPGPSTAHVWIYDVDRDVWRPGPPLPEPRAGGGFVRLGSQLHWFGGGTRSKGRTISEDHRDHWVLDPDGDRTWRGAAPMPNPRNHMAGAAVGGRAYAIGGQHLGDEVDGNQNSVEAYDPATDRWVERAPLPAQIGHIGASTIALDGSILVVGGLGQAQSERAAVHRYDPSLDRWTSLAPLPEGLQSPVAALVDGRVVVVGGAVEFEPRRSTWIGRPVPTERPAPFGRPRTLAQGAGPDEPRYLPGLKQPTTLALDRDGRLYVGTLGGEIHVLRLRGTRPPILERTITTIAERPNHGPDGSTPSDAQGRHLTGLALGRPRQDGRVVLHVAHGDPRIETGVLPGRSTGDPASGTITELIGPGFSDGRDLVRGLPRSSEFHSVNGLALGPDGWLYASVGSNTNDGAPGDYFSWYPETAVSGTVIRLRPERIDRPVDVSRISRFAFVEPCAEGATVGEGCSSRTRVPEGSGEEPGVFEVFATGIRNGYDLVWHSNGSLYLNDNGPNTSFGPVPGTEQGCPAPDVDDPGTEPDELRRITPGSYHGHPNPARDECVRDGGRGSRGAYAPPLARYGFHTSTNGLIEYVGGALDGRLVAVNYAEGPSIVAVSLSADGRRAARLAPVGTGSPGALDLVQGPRGELIVAEFGDRITVREPASRPPSP